MDVNASVTLETNTEKTTNNLDFSSNLGSQFLVPANSTSLFVFSIDYSRAYVKELYNISVFV